MTTVRLIGPGRAGRSLAAALADAGCDVREVLSRRHELAQAARGVDVLVIATPDSVIARVAAQVVPVPGTVVVHLSGALGLDVLSPHPRRASLHPLVPLPSPEVGRVRLRSGITFAVAGEPVAAELARLLGGTVVAVDDEHRAAYHAAACIASNHLVALMGQVERVATSAGLDLDAFLGLARAALTDVAELGPTSALTGPAARGDDATLERHRTTLEPSELPGYEAGVALARRLASDGRTEERARNRPARAGQSRPAGVTSSRATSARAASAQSTALPTGRRARRAGGMRVVTSAKEFSDLLETQRALGRSVGLVPTMGALHDGHRSLIERAAAQCDVVAVTVFVNPLQFNDARDLAAYPRDLEGDAAVARSAGASVVFAPSVQEMYGAQPAAMASSVHVEGVSEGLEGGSRPGHFDGVATVVAKLFSLSGRCRAYFGEKDYQQLAVVRRMVDDLSMPVTVVGCPTVRELDGLALSSRNTRLSTDERHGALALWRALRAGRACVERGERDPGRVGAAMMAVLTGEPLVTPDYVAVVDPQSLRCPPEVRGEVRLLVAARVGEVRLIDNDSARGAGGAVGGGEDLVLVNTGEER
ncbi:MAG TPA: pantoate--beta-alanine ligase [Acidimicrobiales bacterium]|nr:pantoate--beta-alanine ligase [Acidimicrobiales bacterium]